MKVLKILFLALLCLKFEAGSAQSIHRFRVSDSPKLTKRKVLCQEISSSVKMPLILISAGLLSYLDTDVVGRDDIAESRNENFKNFHTPVDDYLQFAPIAVAYGLSAFGVKGKMQFLQKSKNLIKSELLMMAMVLPMKKLTRQLRPDGRGHSSFPSGHTAQAFVAATFMHMEYGHINSWYSIGAYAVAGSVALLRVLNNRHYSSDVLVGAGLGILTTRLIYTNSMRKYKTRITPIYSKRNIRISLVFDL